MYIVFFRCVVCVIFVKNSVKMFVLVSKFCCYDVVVIDKFIVDVLFFEYYVECIVRMDFNGEVDILVENIC